MLRRSLVPIAMFSLVFLSGACDKEKTADPAKADKKAEVAEVEAKPEEAKPEPATPEAKHFDIEADKSGMLARTAAVLETTDATAEDAALRGHLANLSHHAEALSSDQTLCNHIAALRKAEDQPEGQLDSCIIHFEHEIVILGPEVFAQMAQCVMDAKSVADIEVCEAAEKEAETRLHEKHHGDGLSEETCEKAFVKFEVLAMDDAGEHGELVKEILEEVKPDVLLACLDQGTNVEVDCTMKATNMDELNSCEGLF